MNYSRVILKHFDLFRQFFLQLIKSQLLTWEKGFPCKLKWSKEKWLAINHQLVGDNECLMLDCIYHNLFHLANWKIWVPICWYGNYSIHISYETNPKLESLSANMLLWKLLNTYQLQNKFKTMIFIRIDPQVTRMTDHNQQRVTDDELIGMAVFFFCPV